MIVRLRMNPGWDLPSSPATKALSISFGDGNRGTQVGINNGLIHLTPGRFHQTPPKLKLTNHVIQRDRKLHQPLYQPSRFDATETLSVATHCSMRYKQRSQSPAPG